MDALRSFAASTAEDMLPLVEMMRSVALRRSYLRYTGKALVSTFAGESSLFGHERIESAWSFVKGKLEEVCPVESIKYSSRIEAHLKAKVCFVPSFFMEPKRVLDMRCVDGIFNVRIAVKVEDRMQALLITKVVERLLANAPHS